MTTQGLIDEIATKLRSELPASGNLTDAQLDIALNVNIDVYNNIDPDKPVKVKQLTRI